MRFEIRTGGTLLILAGLAVLSGSVFALGLVAGYEMSRQNQVDQSQLASVYTAPSPIAIPSVEAPPSVAAIPAPVSSSMAEAPAKAAPSKAKHLTEDALAPPPEEEPPPPPPGEENAGENPAENPAQNPEAVAAPAAEASTGGVAIASAPAADTAAASAAAQAKRRAFNIQIDAVMDRTGAQQMANRLRRLGYQPTIVQTDIAGQTWYRLRVGPYATADDARIAQNKLRQQYKTAFGSE